MAEPRASESLLKSTVVVDAFTPDITSVGALTGAETTSFAVDFMVAGVISVALTVFPTTSTSVLLPSTPAMVNSFPVVSPSFTTNFPNTSPFLIAVMPPSPNLVKVRTALDSATPFPTPVTTNGAFPTVSIGNKRAFTVGYGVIGSIPTSRTNWPS